MFLLHLDMRTANHKKWTNSTTVWTFSKDWPTRSHCMKFIVPIRGTGVHVEQNSIPVKIINAVDSIVEVSGKRFK